MGGVNVSKWSFLLTSNSLLCTPEFMSESFLNTSYVVCVHCLTNLLVAYPEGVPTPVGALEFATTHVLP